MRRQISSSAVWGRKLFCVCLYRGHKQLGDCTCNQSATAQLKQLFRRESRGKICGNVLGLNHLTFSGWQYENSLSGEQSIGFLKNRGMQVCYCWDTFVEIHTNFSDVVRWKGVWILAKMQPGIKNYLVYIGWIHWFTLEITTAKSYRVLWAVLPQRVCLLGHHWLVTIILMAKKNSVGECSLFWSCVQAG